MRRAAGRELRLPPRHVELLHDAHSLVGHVTDLLNGPLEAREFLAQVVDKRFHAIPDSAPGVRKEEIAGRGADRRACRRTENDDLSLIHTSSLGSPIGGMCSKKNASFGPTWSRCPA